jgi:type II secretory pathway pseudopilin PulG
MVRENFQKSQGKAGTAAKLGPGDLSSMHQASAPKTRTRGFILVMLLIFITSMGIFLTMALPRVATEVQRDQEAELIFRGEAIANAIRLYKAKTGGYPLNLEDLTKLRPRIIRKLYLDPMTRQGSHEGDWDLITAVQPGSSGDKTGLPIVGVKSLCTKDSFAIYHEKTLISDWTFSAADNLLAIPGASAAQAAGLLPGAPGTNTANTPKPGMDPSALGPPTGGTAPPPGPSAVAAPGGTPPPAPDPAAVAPAGGNPAPAPAPQN